MIDKGLWLVLSILSTYCVTLIISQYDGPGNIFLKLREKWLPDAFKTLVSCFVCLSLYTSIPFAIVNSQSLDVVIYWLGIAGGAIFLYMIGDK